MEIIIAILLMGFIVQGSEMGKAKSDLSKYKQVNQLCVDKLSLCNSLLKEHLK